VFPRKAHNSIVVQSCPKPYSVLPSIMHTTSPEKHINCKRNLSLLGKNGMSMASGWYEERFVRRKSTYSTNTATEYVLPDSESAVSRVYFVRRVGPWRKEDAIVFEGRAADIVAERIANILEALAVMSLLVGLGLLLRSLLR